MLLLKVLFSKPTHNKARILDWHELVLTKLPSDKYLIPNQEFIITKAAIRSIWGPS